MYVCALRGKAADCQMEQSAVSASLCSVQGLTTEHRHPDRSPGTPRRTVFFHSFSAKKGNTFHMARRQQEQIGDKAAVLVLRVRIRKISYLNLEWIFGKYIVVSKSASGSGQGSQREAVPAAHDGVHTPAIPLHCWPGGRHRQSDGWRALPSSGWPGQ